MSKSYDSFMVEAKRNKTFMYPLSANLYTGWAYRDGPVIGWFNNRANPAAGWGIFPLDKNDLHWLKSKKVNTKNVFRGSSDRGTNLIKIDLKKGTVAWADNEHLLATDEVKFKKPSAYKKLMIVDSPIARKTFKIKDGDFPNEPEFIKKYG